MKDSLLPYINNYIESKLVAQGGFRTNRGTIETIASMNETILQSEKKFRGRNPVIAFLDIQKAYDSVDWNVLIRQLREEYSMPENLVWMIIELFTGVKSTIADTACTRDSGNGYYRLLCTECKEHYMFSILGNFDLTLLPRDPEAETSNTEDKALPLLLPFILHRKMRYFNCGPINRL